MKSLRKSLNSNKDPSRPQISTPLPLPPVSKPPNAILPPQKVIRALSNYRSQAPQELSFVKGDFFYVLKDDIEKPWYEAHNPVSGSRGLVPRSMFEEFGKHAPSLRTSQLGPNPGSFTSPRQEQLPSPKSQVFYAIVMHDFVAERQDELDAKRGDAITVVAQSNREWFVAKPIGRLGRPGLIPVTFVEIHDPSTGKVIQDVLGLMDRGELPKVEDWKRAMLNYKQNSIALGVIDSPVRSSMASTNSSQNQRQSSAVNNADPPRPQTPDCLPEGILLSADVVSFHYEMEEYWFRLDVVFQPYSPLGQNSLPPAKQLILFRVYNDFYDFQVSLLNQFPREAGKQPPHPRTLPFMPGPANEVDDTLTATRRDELDNYVHELCALRNSGARYILESEVVRRFLALKPGDVDNEVEPRIREIEAMFSTDDYGINVQAKMGRMSIRDVDRSDGSQYENGGRAPTYQQLDYDRRPSSHDYTNGRQSSNDYHPRLNPPAQSHQRNGSRSSLRGGVSNSRPNSPYLEQDASSHSLYNGDSQSRWTDQSYHRNNPSTSSLRSSKAMSSRPGSHSTAASNPNNPPISAANPQTAFVKIKIFDRLADDLIAIRVHPKVTHGELMGKVQARLGAEVSMLRFRDSMTNDFMGIDTDEDLRDWMEGTDKHVLYAD